MPTKIKKLLFLFVITCFLMSGCVRVRHAVPVDLLNNARVFGMQDVRALSGIPSDAFKQDFIKLLEQEERESPPFYDLKKIRTYSVLAISGGAANGAYGAGLLNGWSLSGTRPVFKVVTGISTGALIAPFAFLGSKYDDKLKEIYTKYSTRDIARIRSPKIGIPFSNSIASSWRLERLIEKYFDAALLKEIALEYSKGRRLYVGTTNLDAQRLVIWDMGKIASAGDEKALTLFRKVILASASIPIAFPPVFFKVEVNHKQYNEMHVDGGAIRQVFFLYDVLQGFDKALKEKSVLANTAIYIIRNGYVDPQYKQVPNKLLAIAKRTFETMTNAMSIGDLYELYVFARDGKVDFNLAYIPVTHVSKTSEFVDQAEMRELFNLGLHEAEHGYPWKKLPPGMEK